MELEIATVVALLEKLAAATSEEVAEHVLKTVPELPTAGQVAVLRAVSDGLGVALV